MKAKIHFTLPDGSEDSIVLSGTLEYIKGRAEVELVQRNATDPWSEILEE